VGNSDEAPFVRYWHTIDREGARCLLRLPSSDKAPSMILAQPEQFRLSHTRSYCRSIAICLTEADRGVTVEIARTRAEVRRTVSGQWNLKDNARRDSDTVG
jgi:hypothetical protein